MNPFQYARFVRQRLKKTADGEGRSPVALYVHFARSYIAKRVGLEEYTLLQLYRYSIPEVKTFLTYRDLPRIQRRLNRGVDDSESRQYYEKQTFNAIMADYIHRDWLYMPEADAGTVDAFFRRNERALLKPVGGCMGEHIDMVYADGLDAEEFMARHGGEDSVLEGFIVQHPAMAELNPASVNTVRVITARRNDRVLIVGCALRCGGVGSFVDNFHNGGSAYPLDPETGIVTGCGCSLDGERCIVSPATGCVVVGFRVPHWDKLLEAVKAAALRPTHLGYLAWDIAITAEGVEFVEVNVTTPGNTIIQLDGHPVLARLRTFLNT